MNHEPACEANQSPAYADRPYQERDSDVRQRATRKQYSAAYKLRILDEAEKAKENGKISELLRTEGLRWSHLSSWRKQRDEAVLEALAPRKRGRKPRRSESILERLEALERENRLLKSQLQAQDHQAL